MVIDHDILKRRPLELMIQGGIIRNTTGVVLYEEIESRAKYSEVFLILPEH